MSDINLELWTNCENGKTIVVKRLLTEHVFNTHALASALCDASREGHAECIALLLSYLPADDNVGAHGLSASLNNASLRGHIACVRLLLPHTDATYDSSLAFRRACNNKHVEIMDLLYPYSDAQDALKHMIKHDIPHEFLQEYLAHKERDHIQEHLGDISGGTPKARKI